VGDGGREFAGYRDVSTDFGVTCVTYPLKDQDPRDGESA